MGAAFDFRIGVKRTFDLIVRQFNYPGVILFFDSHPACVTKHNTQLVTKLIAQMIRVKTTTLQKYLAIVRAESKNVGHDRPT